MQYSKIRRYQLIYEEDETGTSDDDIRAPGGRRVFTVSSTTCKRVGRADTVHNVGGSDWFELRLPADKTRLHCRPTHYTAFLALPRCDRVRFYGRPPAAGRRPLYFGPDVSFVLFSRLIFEVAWPIITKFYHMFEGDPDLQM